VALVDSVQHALLVVRATHPSKSHRIYAFTFVCLSELPCQSLRRGVYDVLSVRAIASLPYIRLSGTLDLHSTRWYFQLVRAEIPMGIVLTSEIVC